MANGRTLIAVREFVWCCDWDIVCILRFEFRACRPAARRFAAASGGPVPDIQLDITLAAAIIVVISKEKQHDLPGLS